MNKVRDYEIQYMGSEGSDMYELKIKAIDIEDAYNIALLKMDKEDDRIVSICEIM